MPALDLRMEVCLQDQIEPKTPEGASFRGFF
jgi:hypothetical protein